MGKLFVITTIVATFSIITTSAPSARAGSDSWEPVALSETLGLEIDSVERETYHLFPDVDGFISARFFTKNGSEYRLEYQFRDSSGEHQKRKRISADVWEQSKRHAALVERYAQQSAGSRGEAEAASQYRLALRYAARGQYDLSRTLLADLLTEFPSSSAAAEASEIQGTVGRLAQSRRALFLPGMLYDRSGRTDMLVFAGYYGVWAGIAAPTFFKANDPRWYALGLLTGAPISLYLAHRWTREAEIGKGRASMISLGGHLGTWQGIGWAIMADAGGREAVGAGLLGGLVGIGTATALTHRIHFSEGRGALTGAALPWGTWFGLVAGVAAGAKHDRLLGTVLVGSDAFVLGTALAARNVRMSRARVRLISLMGVMGTVAGFGIDMLGEVGSQEAAFAIAGAGSALGLIAGGRMTRNYDKGKDLATTSPADTGERWAITPQLNMARNPFRADEYVPMVGFHVSF